MNIIKLIKHSDTSNEVLEEISNFKSIRWQYPLAKQLQWMKDNLHSNDVHLLVYLDNELIAYTNFVDIEVIINNVPTPFMGIGNVCTLESGKGYGDDLMKAINSSITQNDWNGILLCKDNLVPYYSKYQWSLVLEGFIASEKLRDINTMVFNFKDEIKRLEYNNSLF